MIKDLPRHPYILFRPFALAFIILCAKVAPAQSVDFGKSYINLTKGLNGGTVETGDTLEIRASFVVRSGNFDSCGYTDAIPVGTSFIPGSIRVLTNEGKIYQQFTDVANDDCGWLSGSTVKINLGFNPAAAPATAFRRGRVGNTHKPSFFLSTCIMIASFRVKVTAATGSVVSTGGGAITYKNGISALQTFTFPSNFLTVYPNYGICSNTIGANAIGTESNGTFGSGKPRNRGTSANVPTGYTYNPFDLNMPNDYYYGVANNTSTRPNYTTLNTWAKPDPTSPTHRVFGVWDIIGDHTGAASLTAGNPAADTVANSNAGYMLVINAAYRIDSAFQQTISNLCPNTYYEISTWMRNICSKCGCDSNGKGASQGAGYLPTAPTDSSGVYPNLTFDIDGFDYYTTGNLKYTGQWVKKGFTYLTGPAQTSFTLKFFNNAPGGGGNDWALDDISVSTCSPNMKYSPSNNPTVCDSNIIKISDTVRSYFNNYTYYKWQRSTNGGGSWSDVTAALGPIAPVWNGTAWQYVSSYTVPNTNTLVANSGDQYRLTVATTSANLSNANCRFTDNGNIVTLNIIDCGVPLETKLLSFTGNIEGGRPVLRWLTSAEAETIYFDVEKSIDGTNFYTIATINKKIFGAAPRSYSYVDSSFREGKAYYRINMRNGINQSKYSRTIQLSFLPESMSLVTVVNPFSNALVFDFYSTLNGKLKAELIDPLGKVLKVNNFVLASGINHLSINHTEGLSQGIYFLRVEYDGRTIFRSVLKQTN